MDKYAVDLDKVLNDFEFSEYSLETSKYNKNAEGLNSSNSSATTSYSPSYLNSRIDTNVKHSITNVFHSLNEYLNSDITPKSGSPRKDEVNKGAPTSQGANRNLTVESKLKPTLSEYILSEPTDIKKGGIEAVSAPEYFKLTPADQDFNSLLDDSSLIEAKDNANFQDATVHNESIANLKKTDFSDINNAPNQNKVIMNDAFLVDLLEAENSIENTTNSAVSPSASSKNLDNDKISSSEIHSDIIDTLSESCIPVEQIVKLDSDDSEIHTQADRNNQQIPATDFGSIYTKLKDSDAEFFDCGSVGTELKNFDTDLKHFDTDLDHVSSDFKRVSVDSNKIGHDLNKVSHGLNEIVLESDRNDAELETKAFDSVNVVDDSTAELKEMGISSDLPTDESKLDELDTQIVDADATKTSEINQHYCKLGKTLTTPVQEKNEIIIGETKNNLKTDSPQERPTILPEIKTEVPAKKVKAASNKDEASTTGSEASATKAEVFASKTLVEELSDDVELSTSKTESQTQETFSSQAKEASANKLEASTSKIEASTSKIKASSSLAGALTSQTEEASARNVELKASEAEATSSKAEASTSEVEALTNQTEEASSINIELKASKAEATSSKAEASTSEVEASTNQTEEASSRNVELRASKTEASVTKTEETSASKSEQLLSNSEASGSNTEAFANLRETKPSVNTSEASTNTSEASVSTSEASANMSEASANISEASGNISEASATKLEAAVSKECLTSEVETAVKKPAQPEVAHATISFIDDIELDEHEIDQYFSEIEKEFESQSTLREFTCDTKLEDEAKVNQVGSLTETEPSIEMDKSDDVLNNNETRKSDTIETRVGVLVPHQASGEVSTKSALDATLDSEISDTIRTQDQNSSRRPSNLSIKTDDSNDSKREINLIGDPGSTPYNNVYINEELKDESDHSTSTSPTFSISSGESRSSETPSTDTVNDDTVVPTITTNEATESVAPSTELSPEAQSSLETPDVPRQGDNPQDTEEASSLTNQSEFVAQEDSGPGWLGKQAPLWIPDSEALACLHCDMKFTMIKRRHHCRACGLVLCSKCCGMKHRLEYLEAEARVCNKCYDLLTKDTNSTSSEVSQESTTSPSRGLGQPNPNNPLEYCSTVPPLQQVSGTSSPPAVMVPVGVLKRKGSNKTKSNKSVMFCDGIRPGSDLTNLDNDFNYSEGSRQKKTEKSLKSNLNRPSMDPVSKSFIPSEQNCLPPTITCYKAEINFSDCGNNSNVVEMLKNEPLVFALQVNLFVHVKIVNMDCCINKTAWCFSTEGLINVGQDELVFLIEFIDEEALVPKDVFYHINNIYTDAVKGTSVKELGISLHNNTNFLDSKNHAGFVYIRSSFQCLQNVIKPKEPFLIGILIHRWEIPWAKLFPLRLILRLGAEYRYYPSPIISTRNRDSVFVEIGHTIINLLADFRNFSYTLPQIRGLTIHMEEKNTTVMIPVNRYDQVIKTLSNSSDHILAFAGNFSSTADSHLVCIQDTQSTDNSYSTHAINIHNKPRKVTGASFIVFNGALKSTSGLTAKSSIVEDGLMIQILPEHMVQIRESLRNMKNHTIQCGCVNSTVDETVNIIWGEADSTFNVGIVSPIDGLSMSGIPSIRVHNGKDYKANSGNRLIRWTEVFIMQNGEESNRNQDPVDISKISESIAKAACAALVKYLDLLVSNSFYKIAIRSTLHVENVSYLAGSNSVKLPPIYMKSLDNELIPVLHRITSNNITESAIVLELIFRILNV